VSHDPEDAFVTTRNARSIRRADIPRSSTDALRTAVIEAIGEGQRLVAMFGTRGQEPDSVELVVVLAADHDGSMYVGRAMVEGDAYQAFTPKCPQAHLFEREIAEQWGVVPEGHPWLKPVRFVRSNRKGHDAWSRDEDKEPLVGVMDFYRVEGAEIHEVAVGPVHAGVIEPGHFRFQCHGEHVFHLEISLGYQHRGVERAVIERPKKRVLHYMETLAGDTSIGHTTAHCQLVESLAGCKVPARAHVVRGLALELERLANHTGDLGALAGDVGYLPTASYCGRLRGDYLNLTAVLCGNRFGRSLVCPGGVQFDVEEARAKTMLDRLKSASDDVESAVELLWSTASVQARFEETGRVTTEVAEALGLVGLAARASGLDRDVRHDLPSGIFRFAQIPVSVWHTGDVFARAYVRWLEIQRSSNFVHDQLKALPSGSLRVELGPLAPDRLCVSLVEGWRGEICHVATTDSSGRIDAYKIVDPSFHNWAGLAMALRDQQISDFPLCNKSFDLSYCGHDL